MTTKPAGTIVLDGSVAEIFRLEPVREAAYLRLGEFPVADPDWEVGIEEMLALPYYQGPDAIGSEPIAYDDHVTWTYDRIPKGDVEVRRASPVTSADGHHLGHVDGLRDRRRRPHRTPRARAWTPVGQA